MMWYIHTMEYSLAIKKNKILPFVATWMDLEGIMLSKINQTQRDKYHMILLYMESRKQTNRTETNS